jgi:hypothetical protein
MKRAHNDCKFQAEGAKMGKKSKVRGPDGKLYELEGEEVYEAPEDKQKKRKKKPEQPGRLTPDPHGQKITPEERAGKITPEERAGKITP